MISVICFLLSITFCYSFQLLYASIEAFYTCFYLSVLLISYRTTLGDVENNSGAKETAITHRGQSKKKGSMNKTRKKLEKTDVKTSDFHQLSKPSFPTKKRVRVTAYPVSETPVRPGKDPKPANTGSELETGKILNEDKRIAANGQDDTLFSPFFWLREENGDEDDEASGKPSGQSTADTFQSNIVPCFSDIKDSEDESPIKMTATVSSCHN